MGEDDFMGNVRIPVAGEITIPRGLFARRNRGTNVPSRKRPVDQILNAVEGESDALQAYKVAIPILPSDRNARPVPTCCHFCFPEVRRTVNPKFTSLGIRNCLKYNTENPNNSWYIRNCSHFIHFWRKQELFTKYKLVSEEEIIGDINFLLELERVILKGKVKSGNETESWKSAASSFLNEFGIHFVSDWVSRIAARFGCWLMSRTLATIFDAVCVHEGQIGLLRSYKKVHPIIYVPLQKSNWDHFILTWVLLDSNLTPPVLLARKSLLTDPVLGKLARVAGCVGRYPDVLNGLNPNPTVPTCFEFYLRGMLRKGMSLNFAVEKHRSRNGIPATTFTGTELCSIIASCIEQNDVEEAYIVPVSISYEKFPEQDVIGNYSEKLPVSFLRGLWNILRLKLGSARVNFGHPISFREYQKVMSHDKIHSLISRCKDEELFWLTEGYCNALSSKDLNWDYSRGSVTSLSSLYEDMAPPPNLKATLFGDALISHTVYDAYNSTVFMSTNLVAFLLMTKYRECRVNFEKLLEDFEDLTAVLRERKRDVGFSSKGSMESILQRALQLLGPRLIKSTKEAGKMYLSPYLSPSSLIELSYYSNPLVSCFIMEGIIATAIFALQGKRLSLFSGTKAKIFIQEDHLIEKATRLSLLLKAQFLLHPPCQQLDVAIKCGLDKARDEYLLCYEMRKSYRYEDDADDGWTGVGYGYSSERLHVQAIEEPHVYKKLQEVRGFVIPYLHVYAEIVSALHVLVPQENEKAKNRGVLESRLVNTILDHIKTAPHLFPELLTRGTVKNFISALQHLDIIEEYYDENGTDCIKYCLRQDYQTKSRLDAVQDNILYYCAGP